MGGMIERVIYGAITVAVVGILLWVVMVGPGSFGNVMWRASRGLLGSNHAWTIRLGQRLIRRNERNRCRNGRK